MYLQFGGLRVVHVFLQRTSEMFYHVVIDELRHDCDCHSSVLALDNLQNLVVTHSNNVLAIYFRNEVVGEHPISGCRRVLDDGINLSFLELETDVSSAILDTSDGSLEWSVSYSKPYLGWVRFLQEFDSLLLVPPCNTFAIDLNNLVSVYSDNL